MWYEYDWPAAETELKRALELNPNSSYAHQWYGLLLLDLQRLDESIAEGKRAVELDPLSAEANTCLGVELFCARQYDKALQQLRTTLELEPNYWFAHEYLGRCLLQRGDVSGAIATLEKATQMDGAAPEVWSSLGYAYAIAGKPDEARKMISELETKPGYGHVYPYSFAMIYAGLGEKDKAFEYLDKEYKEGAYNLGYLKTDPQLDSLRSDPRFRDLLQRIFAPKKLTRPTACDPPHAHGAFAYHSRSFSTA